MKFRGGKIVWVGVLVGTGAFLSIGADTNTSHGAKFSRPAATNTAPIPLTPPAAEPRKSPVDFFRQLLAMNPGERMQALSNRPPENRRLVLAKVREYESLSPNQRELRLQATELRWYLWPLMSSSDTNRGAQTALIPEPMRELVKVRLEQWDSLAAPVQRDLLTNEATVRFFTELTNSTPQQQTNMFRQLSQARRELLQAGVLQIQAMPEEQRQRLFQRFNQFFDLTTDEKSKALGTLSEADRQQIEKTLKRFGQLSPENRRQCLFALQRYVSLSLPERQQFLKNAERWKLMTPEQRQNWCELVSKLSLQPPLPEGVNLVPNVPPLPKPGAPRPARRAPAVATNLN